MVLEQLLTHIALRELRTGNQLERAVDPGVLLHRCNLSTIAQQRDNTQYSPRKKIQHGCMNIYTKNQQDTAPNLWD
jgi:hypothetical protein